MNERKKRNTIKGEASQAFSAVAALCRFPLKAPVLMITKPDPRPEDVHHSLQFLLPFHHKVRCRDRNKHASLFLKHSQHVFFITDIKNPHMYEIVFCLLIFLHECLCRIQCSFSHGVEQVRLISSSHLRCLLIFLEKEIAASFLKQAPYTFAPVYHSIKKINTVSLSRDCRCVGKDQYVMQSQALYNDVHCICV